MKSKRGATVDAFGMEDYERTVALLHQNEDIERFVRESNRIEGIHRNPSADEISAHKKLLTRDRVTVANLEALVAVCQPSAKLRATESIPGVRVGNHIAPPSGPAIVAELKSLLRRVSGGGTTPWQAHCEYETLHPFTDGNGRSGRAVWLWHMQKVGQLRRALGLGFLHEFYYQTLAESQRTARKDTP